MIPDAQNSQYRFDSELYDMSDATGSVFRVGKGKEATRTFPFRRQDLGPYLTDSAGWSYGDVTDRSFRLNITYRPVTRTFYFTAE